MTGRALTVVLMCSVSLNVLQAVRIVQLASHGITARERHTLQAGTKVPPIRAQNLENRDVTIAFGDRRTLVYVFTPSCVWCARNYHSIQTLVEAARRQHVQVVGLSLSGIGLKAYLAEKPLDATILHSPSPEMRDVYALGATPTTLLIAPEGRVERVWQGAFTGETAKQIEALFGIVLPDLEVAEGGQAR